MVDHYLKDLETQHPGGWEDIINYVNENYGRYQATYKRLDAKATRVVDYGTKGEARSHLEYDSREIEEKLPKLEEVKHGVTGLAASIGWNILRSLDLPLPGSKEWLKPCSKWRTSEKGK